MGGVHIHAERRGLDRLHHPERGGGGIDARAYVGLDAEGDAELLGILREGLDLLHHGAPGVLVVHLAAGADVHDRDADLGAGLEGGVQAGRVMGRHFGGEEGELEFRADRLQLVLLVLPVREIEI